MDIFIIKMSSLDGNHFFILLKKSKAGNTLDFFASYEINQIYEITDFIKENKSIDLH